MEQEIPIELDCWMLKWGIMPIEHMPRDPDIVWAKEETDHQKAVRTGIGMGWMPKDSSEEPPF
tara:strand:- start:206 stop:394 length:189 start_codon:yes stop_codon:yes gene_type:complete